MSVVQVAVGWFKMSWSERRVDTEDPEYCKGSITQHNVRMFMLQLGEIKIYWLWINVRVLNVSYG